MRLSGNDIIHSFHERFEERHTQLSLFWFLDESAISSFIDVPRERMAVIKAWSLTCLAR
jgi:hypothetical protein